MNYSSSHCSKYIQENVKESAPNYRSLVCFRVNTKSCIRSYWAI